MEFSTDRKSLLWYSLVATQLSVTGGILSLISGAQAYAALIFLAPITAVCGILLFSHLRTLLGSGNLSYDTLSRTDGSSLPLPFFLILSTALVYIFVLGWELYVGATVVSKISGYSQTAVIAVLLGLVVLGYTRFSGFTRAVVTDRFQLYVAVALILLLMIINIDSWSAAELRSKIDFSGNIGASPYTSAIFVLTLLIVNISAQLQSPSNWIIAKSADVNAFKQMQNLAAPTLLIIWSGIIVFALGLDPSMAKNWLDIFDTRGSLILSAMLFVGVIALIVSTIDTTMLGISNSLNHAYCYLRGDEFTEFHRVTVRSLNVSVIAIALAISFGLLSIRPELFYSLLSITGLISVYTGYVFYFAIGKPELVSSSRFVPISLFCLFVLLALTQMFGLLDQSSQVGFNIVLAGTILGFILPLRWLHSVFTQDKV